MIAFRLYCDAIEHPGCSTMRVEFSQDYGATPVSRDLGEFLLENRGRASLTFVVPFIPLLADHVVVANPRAAYNVIEIEDDTLAVEFKLRFSDIIMSVEKGGGE